MSLSGANMEIVVRARDHHNATCSLGPAREAHINPSTLELFGWEDGDVIGGLLIVGNADVTPKNVKIHCAGDGVDERLEERDLVCVGA